MKIHTVQSSLTAKASVGTLCLAVLALLAAFAGGCKPNEAPEANPWVSPKEAKRTLPICPEGGTELTYRLENSFPSGLSRLHGLALGPAGRLYAAGEGGVKVMQPGGELLAEWATPAPATCVAVGEDGKVYVGLKTSVVVYDENGEETDRWDYEGKGGGRFSYVKGIAVAGINVFVADAGNRCVHRFAMDGDFICAIGEREPGGGNPGLVCPSPYLDCVVGADERLHVTNPGRLRVETYDFNGNLMRFWGQSGLRPRQFIGCCNPTNVALLPGGQFVTAEKETPRVKVYSVDGELLACLGPKHFSPEAAGLDLATDSDGRIYVADPASNEILVFGPAGGRGNDE